MTTLFRDAMQLSTFLKRHERRTWVDGDGWYEPCADEFGEGMSRMPKVTRGPVSNAFVLNAPLGTTRFDVPNCLLHSSFPTASYPHLLRCIPGCDARIRAIWVHDEGDAVDLYRTVDLQHLNIFQSCPTADGRHVTFKMGRFPTTRAEFRTLLALSTNKKLGASLLSKPIVMPAEEHDWYERMLRVNRWSDEELKFLRKLAYNQQVVHLPRQKPPETQAPVLEWHVHGAPVHMSHPRYAGIVHTHLALAGSRRVYGAAPTGLHILVSLQTQGGCRVKATTASGAQIVWNMQHVPASRDLDTHVRLLFKGAPSAAAFFKVPRKKYEANARQRSSQLAMVTEISQTATALYGESLVDGELVATTCIRVGPYTTQRGGFVFTTDAGLNMGLPHMATSTRVGDLGNSGKYSGMHYNVFHNSACVSAAGRPLSNVEGRLEMGMANGDRGLRLALLSAIDCLCECGRRLPTLPDVLVFEVTDPTIAAQICGMVHAFPVRSAGSTTRLLEKHATVVYYDGRFYRCQDDGSRGHEIVTSRGISFPIFRTQGEYKRNVSKFCKFLKKTKQVPRTARWSVRDVIGHRGQQYQNEMMPLQFKDGRITLPDHADELDVIAVQVNGERDTVFLHNTTITDPRLLLTSTAAYKCTETVDDFVLVRPFPTSTELIDLKQTILYRCDVLLVEP